MKNQLLILIFLCIATDVFPQNKSAFENFVETVCQNTYNKNRHDENDGSIINGEEIVPRRFLYKYEENIIKQLLSDESNDNDFYESIMLKYDTTKNQGLQYLFFHYYIDNYYDKKKEEKNTSKYLNIFLKIMSDTSTYYLYNIAYIQNNALLNIDKSDYNNHQINVIANILTNFDSQKIEYLYESGKNKNNLSDFDRLANYYANTCLIASRLYMNNELKNIEHIYNEFGKYVEKTNKFNLALARLGNKRAIQHYVSILKKRETNSLRLGNEISFILQKDVIDFVIKMLYSENYFSKVEEDGEDRSYYKYDAMNILKQIIEFDFSNKQYEDLNLKLSFISSSNLDDELTRMRLFFTLNKNYVILKDPAIYYYVESW